MPATRRASPSRLVTFYALLLTQTFSLIGSRMTAVAIGIWVFRETGQTAPLLLIAFFTELPGMVGGSLAGVLVDRWERKRVLILADLGQAAGSLLLILSFTSGAFQFWPLYAAAFLQGVFARCKARRRARPSSCASLIFSSIPCSSTSCSTAHWN